MTVCENSHNFSNALWCNDNTSDFGSEIIGLSPVGATTAMNQCNLLYGGANYTNLIYI